VSANTGKRKCLHARAEGYAEVEVQIGPTASETMDLVLEPEAIASGRTLTALGEPLAGVKVVSILSGPMGRTSHRRYSGPLDTRR
jgi:hypothetical protein